MLPKNLAIKDKRSGTEQWPASNANSKTQKKKYENVTEHRWKTNLEKIKCQES